MKHKHKFFCIFILLCATGLLSACGSYQSETLSAESKGNPDNPAEQILQEEEHESDNLILGPGTYQVGVDIPAGKYDCIADSGFGVLRGDIAAMNPSVFVQTMGRSESSIGNETVSVEAAPSYSNLTLTDGDTVYIEMSLFVEFAPK